MRNRSLILFSRYFFLIVFLGFFISNTFFDHVHIYDGNLIVHSHPFKHGENGKPLHTHLDGGYLLVYLLNTLLSNVVLSIFLFYFFNILVTRIFSQILVNKPTGIFNYVFHLRGPPFN